MNKWIILSFLFFIYSNSSFAQKKLDLDDIQIKGELTGDGRFLMLGRQKNQIKNFVKFRTNFRKEMKEELLLPYPKYKTK